MQNVPMFFIGQNHYNVKIKILTSHYTIPGHRPCVDFRGGQSITLFKLSDRYHYCMVERRNFDFTSIFYIFPLAFPHILSCCNKKNEEHNIRHPHEYANDQPCSIDLK
jgi:hypothetical protein